MLHWSPQEEEGATLQLEVVVPTQGQWPCPLALSSGRGGGKPFYHTGCCYTAREARPQHGLGAHEVTHASPASAPRAGPRPCHSLFLQVCRPCGRGDITAPSFRPPKEGLCLPVGWGQLGSLQCIPLGWRRAAAVPWLDTEDAGACEELTAAPGISLANSASLSRSTMGAWQFWSVSAARPRPRVPVGVQERPRCLAPQTGDAARVSFLSSPPHCARQLFSLAEHTVPGALTVGLPERLGSAVHPGRA